MSGKDLVDVDAFSAVVHVPLATEDVDAATVEVPFQSLANRTNNLNIHKASLAGATFTGIVTGDVGEFNWPVTPGDRSYTAEANNGASVTATNSFVMTKSVGINQVIVSAGTYTTPTVWTTPARPWILEGFVIQITGNATVDAPAGYVHLSVLVGSVEFLAFDLAALAAGTTYLVNGTTATKVIFGLDAVDRTDPGPLTSPLASNSADSLGYGLDDMSNSIVSLAAATTSLWGKQITVAVTHGSGTARTVVIPIKVIAWGRFF